MDVFWVREGFSFRDDPNFKIVGHPHLATLYLELLHQLTIECLKGEGLHMGSIWEHKYGNIDLV